MCQKPPIRKSWHVFISNNIKWFLTLGITPIYVWFLSTTHSTNLNTQKSKIFGARRNSKRISCVPEKPKVFLRILKIYDFHEIGGIPLFKKAGLGKWITFLIFIAVIIFLVLLTKNKGSFASTFADIKGLFGK